MSFVRLSRQADADLDSIADYLADYSPRAAVAELRRIWDGFALLSAHPGLGERRDDLHSGLRVFTPGKYLILYMPSEDRIEVIGVIHGARDLAALFRRGDR